MSSTLSVIPWCGALLAGALLWSPLVGAQPKPVKAPPAEAPPAEAPPEPAKAVEAPPEPPAQPAVEGAAAAPGSAEAAAAGVEEAAPAGVEQPAANVAPPLPAAPPPAPTWAPPAPPDAQPSLAHDTRYRAVDEPDEAEPEPEPEGPYLPHWFSAEIGVRNFFILDEGFDPYSDSDFLAGGAFTLSFVPLHFGPVDVGVAAEYDLGHRTAVVRGVDSALTLHRLGGGLQLQVRLSRLRFFARAMPAAWYAAASLDDSGFERQLSADGWTWGFEASGGLAVRIGSAGGHSHDAMVRFWLLAELGYGFAGDIDMVFSPAKDDTDPRQFGGVELPPLQPSGLVNRLAFAVSF